MRKLLVICALLMVGPGVGYASVDDLVAEQKRVLAGANMSGELSAKNLNDMLEFTGIESVEIFDVIEKRLAADMSNEAKAEEMAWLAKTLALSGNKKYQATLNAANENGSKKLRKHVSIALTRLDSFAAYNKALGANLNTAPSGGLERQRIINALSSDFSELVRWGGKRVFFAHYLDRELVEAAFKALKIQLPKAVSDDEIDATAWLIKAVGAYGSTEEKAYVREIADNKNGNFSKKFVKYAKISLK